MFFSCTVFVLSGRGLCNGPILRPEEFYWLWCVFECDQVKTKTLYTCCEQAGRRGKDCETKQLASSSSLLTSLTAASCRAWDISVMTHDAWRDHCLCFPISLSHRYHVTSKWGKLFKETSRCCQRPQTQASRLFWGLRRITVHPGKLRKWTLDSCLSPI
jgi:hypothetical protein